MKRIFGIFSLLIYLFSINSLVHSSTMGFFDSHTNNSHCGSDNSSTTEQNNDKEHCFVSVTSNDFSCISQKEIKLGIFQNYLTDIISSNYNFQILNKLNFIANKIVNPPGKYYQKYLAFSDLFGVIVKLS
ncbi:MAG: hypothetical protein WAZ12_03375 [Candidatus Absconditicoccaceae bacterium]